MDLGIKHRFCSIALKDGVAPYELENYAKKLYDQASADMRFKYGDDLYMIAYAMHLECNKDKYPWSADEEAMIVQCIPSHVLNSTNDYLSLIQQYYPRYQSLCGNAVSTASCDDTTASAQYSKSNKVSARRETTMTKEGLLQKLRNNGAIPVAAITEYADDAEVVDTLIKEAPELFLRLCMQVRTTGRGLQFSGGREVILDCILRSIKTMKDSFRLKCQRFFNIPIITYDACGCEILHADSVPYLKEYINNMRTYEIVKDSYVSKLYRATLRGLAHVSSKRYKQDMHDFLHLVDDAFAATYDLVYTPIIYQGLSLLMSKVSFEQEASPMLVTLVNLFMLDFVRSKLGSNFNYARYKQVLSSSRLQTLYPPFLLSPMVLEVAEMWTKEPENPPMLEHIIALGDDISGILERSVNDECLSPDEYQDAVCKLPHFKECYDSPFEHILSVLNGTPLPVTNSRDELVNHIQALCLDKQAFLNCCLDASLFITLEEQDILYQKTGDICYSCTPDCIYLPVLTGKSVRATYDISPLSLDTMVRAFNYFQIHFAAGAYYIDIDALSNNATQECDCLRSLFSFIEYISVTLYKLMKDRKNDF